MVATPAADARKPLTPRQRAALRAMRTPRHTGNKVRAALKLAGATQSDIVKATRFSAGYVNDVAQGRLGTITIENAWIFAAFFGVDPGDLFPARATRTGAAA